MLVISTVCTHLAMWETSWSASGTSLRSESDAHLASSLLGSRPETSSAERRHRNAAPGGGIGGAVRACGHFSIQFSIHKFYDKVVSSF